MVKLSRTSPRVSSHSFSDVGCTVNQPLKVLSCFLVYKPEATLIWREGKGRNWIQAPLECELRTVAKMEQEEHHLG